MSKARPQPPFALTVSAEARAIMDPLFNAEPAPEMTATLMRNPVTRAAVRATAANYLKPMNKSRAKRYGVGAIFVNLIIYDLQGDL